mgnify:CR=1 FL=1
MSNLSAIYAKLLKDAQALPKHDHATTLRNGARIALRLRNGVQTVTRTTTGDNSNRNATLSGKYSQYAGEAHTVTTGAEIERRTRDETRLAEIL